MDTEGNSTAGADRISILSMEQAEIYKDILDKMTGVDYWLRTQGSREGTAVFVSGGGEIMDEGYSVSSDAVSVRPVIRINCVQAAEEETK